MKTKQAKEDQDKNIDEEVIEPKTRARKKASDALEEDKNKSSQDEPKTSKETKKVVNRPKAIVKKKPLGIRKTLRNKKVIIAKEKTKKVIKQTVTRARKAAIKTEPDNSQGKETVQLIPASEIKKEPLDDTPNSRSSSPRTASRRHRLSSDLMMMKTMLGDSPSSLVLGPRTSPYSMRSERSNSPSLFEGKNLRSGKPRKVKNNLLNEVVMKEQKKRRRLLSDSKTADVVDTGEDCKKLKRVRSCSREGSEISKCSENTESDLSLSEPLNDTDSGKELNKNLEKSKTDLDVDIENNVQISTLDKVPSVNDKVTEIKQDAESTSNKNNKKKMSLKRSPSLDADNNNSNRLKLVSLDAANIENKLCLKTEDDLQNRSSILSCMSKTFNSREVNKNIKKARRGRKVAALCRPDPNKICVNSTIANNTNDDKQETLESLSKEIDDLINNLDQNIDRDHELATDAPIEKSTDDNVQVKQVPKFNGSPKPLNDQDSINITVLDTPVKNNEPFVDNSDENTPSKIDEGETIRLHYEENTVDKTLDTSRHEITYKCSSVASIDKLMDRLKEFEEFDKRRQRLESESKASDNKPMMVTNDVVLIPKSGADIKPLKDIQSVRSPEKPIEKENVLSCFENNSAISIVKRDQVRKSIDVDLPNSVTLIKRNSLCSRKESISSNHSRESDAISIFEKSLGKDVTLTEIRKSVDKSAPNQLDLHQFASLHPNNPTHNLVGGVVLDANEISITPRVITEHKLYSNDKQILPKRKSIESISRKSSESTNEDDKMAVIEKIKSPTHQNISPAISISSTPVAVKSPESIPMETEALSPPLENIKPEDISMSSGVSKCGSIKDTAKPETAVIEGHIKMKTPLTDEQIAEAINIEDKLLEDKRTNIQNKEKIETDIDVKPKITKQSRSARSSTKGQPGSDNKTITDAKKGKEQSLKTNSTIPQKENIKLTIEKHSKADAIDNQSYRRNSYSNSESKPKEYVLRHSASESKADMPTDIERKLAKKPKSAKTTELQEQNTHPDGIKERKEFVLRQLGMLKKDDNKTVIKTDNISKQNITVNEDINNEFSKNLKQTPSTPNIVNDKASNDNEIKPAKPVKLNRSESQPGPSNIFNETPETKKHKEYVLRTLGLITHKEAKETKIEKLKQKERIYGANMSGMIKNKTAKSADYTGTLKTVIKLNRSSGERDKKKQRSSLKMTFQKSKYRSGKPAPEIGEAANEDDAYYTIERREGVAGAASDGGHRKSYYSNRLNNHDTEALPEPTEPKETLNLVIPEKASSFSIHPGRLCMDQCFYCGGKFGLFDTPCHIAQIKSSDRQKKILDNEEKLTIDSCLCDACYRHVDRRANCPSYRKRPPGRHVDAPSLASLPSPPGANVELDYKAPSYGQTNITKSWQQEKPVSPPLEEESEEEPPAPAVISGRIATCHTEGCMGAADYSIRRKWLIKMRSSVNKILKLKCDYPGLHTIPLCGEHYRALAPLMACVLCRRRITKHHNVHFIHHGYMELNPLLCGAGVPVQFSERPVVCNACRNYCTLLQRAGHDNASAKAYRRKLLQIYNIQVPPESENEGEENMTQEEAAANKQKKKQRTKSKQRKSTEPEQTSESSEKTNESTPEKEKQQEVELKDTTIREEEDIESLISSNKILVPGANKPNELIINSDCSENENICEFDSPFIHVDKQTELQYLLQKQNNPAQFLKPPNLTQKHRNIMKMQTGIQKPGQLHRIMDKNAKRIHKIGMVNQKQDKILKDIFEDDRSEDGVPILKNINLNDECTIETIPNKRSADINTLRNKWQMSESFTQVKKNLSELSKKFPGDKELRKNSDAKYSNPVKRLETNPSISVRELFPGEEEMNLQCNVEFNNVKGVTPEGWEKCNSMIQYDLETKKLWTELQRPYGNQSSFLRHLILLEKYFRSGDLVLSHNASPHAINYSDSVQSRLRAYDNVAEPPKRNETSISLIEFRKKPSNTGKSLLKSNQNETDSKKFMPPPMVPKPKIKEKKAKPLPPELIAINTPNAQGRKSIQNVLHNIQQLVKGVSASDPTEVAAAPLYLPKYEPPKEKKELPLRFETPKKTKPTSKPWRPTLMPITPENLAKISREPAQVAVDGRHLPSLVQVMSSGKRYHITLQDYNKMCIMRREKLQQLRDVDKKRLSIEENTVITEIQPSTMLGNGGSVVQNLPEEKSLENSELCQNIGNAATILKNVGLKNITIAPIPAKTATVTSQMLPSPMLSSPLLVSTPMKIPQLGPAVSITSENIYTSNAPVMSHNMMMPKIPKSLTVIPQTVNIPPMTPMGNVPSTSVGNPSSVLSSHDVMRP